MRSILRRGSLTWVALLGVAACGSDPTSYIGTRADAQVASIPRPELPTAEATPTPPGTTTPTPTASGEAEALAVLQAANAGEILHAAIALQEATDPRTRAFAARMLDAHLALAEQLEALAEAQDITPAASALSERLTQEALLTCELLLLVASADDPTVIPVQVPATATTAPSLLARERCLQLIEDPAELLVAIPTASADASTSDADAIGSAANIDAVLDDGFFIPNGDDGSATGEVIVASPFDHAYIISQAGLHRRVLDIIDVELVPGIDDAELVGVLARARGDIAMHLTDALALSRSLASCEPIEGDVINLDGFITRP